MILSYQGIQDAKAWADAGVVLPSYDWKQMRSKRDRIGTFSENCLRNLIKRGLSAVHQAIELSIGFLWDMAESLSRTLKGK